MNKRSYTTYTREFKLEAIRPADESDKPVTQVASELGLRVNQIYKWKKQMELKVDNAFAGPGKGTDKDAEIRCLKTVLAAANEENEFLKEQPSSSRGASREVCGYASILWGVRHPDDVSSDGCLA